MTNKRGKRKTKVGLVTSDKMERTVVVKVEGIYYYSLFNKRVKKSKKFKADNPENKARLGDKVIITETRPLSKDKRWRVAEILEKASG